MKRGASTTAAWAGLAALLAALCGPVAAQETVGTYQLVSHDLPRTVVPGQRVVGHLDWKVITPGQPAYTGPNVDFYATGDTQRGMRLPGDKLNPWSLPDKQAPGDGLRVSFTFDVPLDFPPGPAAFALLLARNVPGKGWQYAQVLDTAGQPSADAVRVPVQVQDATGAPAPALPLVVRPMPEPQLDGQVQAGEWQAAGQVGAFVENAGGLAPRAGTTAYAGYDTTNLYLAYVCQEPKLTATVRAPYDKHDGPVWNNDCVEVFLNPAADRVSYMHFLVDILGQRHDLLGSDSYGFNPVWTVKVAEGNDQWSVEMAIPFSSLGVATPQSGDAWYGNLCRERKAVIELSAWQATGGSFDAPGRFGLLVFADLRQLLANRAAKLTPGTDWPAALREPVNQWQDRLAAWRKLLAELPQATAGTAYAQLASALETLSADLTRLRLKAGALAGQGVLAARAAPYEPFAGEPGATDKPSGPLALVALQGEWLDLAWNLTNLTDQPLTLRCQLRGGDPKGPAAFLHFGLPGVRSLWRLATPVAAGDGRPIQDALVPLPAGTVTIPPGLTAQVWLSLQAEAPLPGGQAAGQVRLERLDGGTGEPVEWPLSIRVVPADIRTPRAVHAFTWNFLSDPVTADRAWLEAHYRDLRDHGVDVAMVSGLHQLPRIKANADGTLAEPLNFDRLDAHLAAMRPYFTQYYVGLDIWEKRDLRRDLFDLPFDSPAYEKAFKAWFGAVLEHLLTAGLTRDQFMVNPYDESVNEASRKLAGWIKAVDPGVRVVIDCSTPDVAEARRMDALTDVWVPHYKVHFAEDMKPFFDLLSASGKPHWCYFYSEGGNDKGQDPTRHYLAKFWWAYQAGVTGVGYWAQQYYGDPWYRAQSRAAYDTSLVYPVEGGVVASRRWEAWRRGWQDYQLLALTRAALEARGDAAGRAKLAQRVESVVAVPGDPVRAEAAREWLRAIIGDRR
ncbi:MAG: DUF4091 domain-containing protein [Armatimonadetes bacterium]|nr:DUF4091 domain-containing protein [Armatimonadota bacterium]